MKTPTDRKIESFLKGRRFAVVGASGDRSKFGNKVYRDLKSKGYVVFAVNPHLKTVEGDACYPNLKALPGPVDGVVFVTPPAVTEAVLREAKAAGISMAWTQPGAGSAEAIDFCAKNGIELVHHECIMVEASGTRNIA